MTIIYKRCLMLFLGFICASTSFAGELTIDDLRVMSEPELEQLFYNGEAVSLPEHNIPAGQRIEYIGLPLAKPADDAANKPWELIWGGKTFYRDKTGKMRLDNKLLPKQKRFLGWDIDFVSADVSLDTSIEDGQAVILIDYANTEIPLFRPVRDEIRLISAENDLYIGRANAYIFPKSNYLNYLRSVTLISLVNKLLDNGYNCKNDNGGEFPQGEYCFAIWFALQKK